MTEKIWTRKELIKKYIEFFKKHSHKHIPSASLIPENDPTVLFTTAGMHPLVPYLLGTKHPLGKRLVNVQKCIRTGDIEEVGDRTHHTFFEMLGNWSLGDYWKKEAITMTFDFITKELGVPKEKIEVTCFKGIKEKDIETKKETEIPKDTESEAIWLSLGVKKSKIKFLGKEDNFWGPAGQTGPCGPDTEIFVNGNEIGNNVLMQYVKDKNGNYETAIQKNIDFGGGVERMLAILNNLDDNYLTEVWQPIIKEVELISGKKYISKSGEETKAIRIIADHIKAAVFLLGDDKHLVPSNTDQGYVLRRLIRRAIRYGRKLGIKEPFTSRIAKKVIPIYLDYQELERNHKFIITELDKEESKFNETLDKGLKKFNELINNDELRIISGKEAFLLFQSYGFPIEITQELADEREIKVDLEEFNEEFQRHQDLSRTLSGGRFKSGLADDSEKTKKLHTATHLLNEALRQVLKDPEIKQRGSNITSERLRFDFNFSRKLTNEEIKQVEEWINDKIKQKMEIHREEMSLKQALNAGAQAEFGSKYPEMVSIYSVIDPKTKKVISKEICTGPHVSNTSELGKFKILKEESSASGIRRIKATVEEN